MCRTSKSYLPLLLKNKAVWKDVHWKNKLASRIDVTQYFRPSLAPNCVHKVIYRCLQYNPENRPDFDTISLLLDEVKIQLMKKDGQYNKWMPEFKRFEMDIKESNTYLSMLAPDILHAILYSLNASKTIEFQRPLAPQ